MDFIRKHGVDSANVDINGAVQPLESNLNTGGVEVDLVYSVSALDHEKFMNQELTIYLADAASESDPQICEINVNGHYVMGVRGNEMTLRRYHLAVLAQAKSSRVRQRKVVAPDGSMSYVEENILQLTYPFQVTHDPDLRRGGPWLKELLQRPC